MCAINIGIRYMRYWVIFIFAKIIGAPLLPPPPPPPPPQFLWELINKVVSSSIYNHQTNTIHKERKNLHASFIPMCSEQRLHLGELFNCNFHVWTVFH